MIREGTKVTWEWGNGTASGTVVETFSESVTRTIAGNEVTRHGERHNKALLIGQEDGSRVLKLEKEVTRKDA
ncbi:MAG: hypothetical protein CMC08_07355 [Flavobacteriaceae bacterium]|nr:hypothetical protein [Flavobacteriaceae bacterium]